LTPVEAVPAAIVGLALAALMLLARRFDDWRKWAGLAFGLPVFFGLALVYAGVAASYYVVPAKAELAHLEATTDIGYREPRFAAWLAFLDAHAGTPEAEEAAGIVARRMWDSEIPEQTRALLQLYRKAPERHAPVLKALWEQARTSKPLAEALAGEGLTLEAQPPAQPSSIPAVPAAGTPTP
jgi:hypothetical protein